MKAAEQRAFTPGDGATPPALTGREREEAVLTQCLADLLGGGSPPHNVVLTGPRGTGKTVLLNWFERVCRDRETQVDVIALTPDDIPTGEALIDVLSPRACSGSMNEAIALHEIVMDEMKSESPLWIQSSRRSPAAQTERLNHFRNDQASLWPRMSRILSSRRSRLVE